MVSTCSTTANTSPNDDDNNNNNNPTTTTTTTNENCPPGISETASSPSLPPPPSLATQDPPPPQPQPQPQTTSEDSPIIEQASSTENVPEEQPPPPKRRLDNRGRPKEPMHLFVIECAKQYIAEKLCKIEVAEARVLLEDKRKLSPSLREFGSASTVISISLERIWEELREGEKESLTGMTSESEIFKNQFELTGAVMKAFGEAIDEFKKQYLVIPPPPPPLKEGETSDPSNIPPPPTYSNPEMEEIFKIWDEINKRLMANRNAEPKPVRARGISSGGSSRYAPYPDNRSRGRPEPYRRGPPLVHDPRDDYYRRDLRYDSRHGGGHYPPRGPAYDRRPPPRSPRWDGRPEMPIGGSRSSSYPPPPPPPPHHPDNFYDNVPRAPYSSQQPPPPPPPNGYPTHHDPSAYAQQHAAYSTPQAYSAYPTGYVDPSNPGAVYAQQAPYPPQPTDVNMTGYAYPPTAHTDWSTQGANVAATSLQIIPFNSSMVGRHMSIPLPIDFMSGPQEGGRLSMPEPHEVLGIVKGYIIRDAQGSIGMANYEFTTLG